MKPRPTLARTTAWVALVLGALVLAGCSTEQRLRSQAQETLGRGEYEASVKLLEEGLKSNPQSVVLRSNLLATKSSALDALIGEALVLRRSGNLEAAQARLQRALSIDPINERVLRLQEELIVNTRQNQTQQKAAGLESAGKLEQALALAEQGLKDDPRHDGLLTLQRRISARLRAQQVAASQGVLMETRPVSLDFTDANLRNVLDLVSRNSGINFVLDKDVRSDARVTVFLKNAKVEDALDLIINSNQLAKKVLDGRTIAIYPNTPEKQKDYQEQVVRVFYLAGSEAKNAAAFLKAMLKIKDPFVEERTNMLAIRDSQQNVQLAEKLIAVFDAGEPEVLLEVEVLEVSSKRMLQLGVNPPTSFSLSLLPPKGATGWDMSNINWVRPQNIGVGVGNATVDFKRELGDFTTLANPRIRVRNKEKATVMVGDKIPVVTTTTGNAGFVSDSVTYLDVGLKLNVEPTVYADDEVAVRIGLEVSTLGSAVKTSSGTLAYQIGTRNATTLLRLQDGETQMLAGLISRDERSSATGLPGATDLPLLGRLFSDHQDSSNRTELVLAITPRILRNIRKPEAQDSEVWVGTEAAPKLRPYGGLRPDLSAPAATPPANPAAGGAASASAPAASAKPAAAATPETPAADAQQPPSLALAWVAPSTARVGEVFDVQIALNTNIAIRGLPIEVAADASKLQLVEAREGEFFNQAGAATTFTHGALDAGGKLNMGVIRNQATGAAGQGVVFRLKFKALAAGPLELRIPKFTALPLGGVMPESKPAMAHTVQVAP